ncbi:unnamed protein product [Blepharisma stoltei]|uniref:TNFR-Cys domain-containing protein n=1 Tax=Blepharisma stoltei TaxID=1481888 RepID=A0AAU9JSA2_9CILI|nr:unnamed protein product [Blepharisma stoltei]
MEDGKASFLRGLEMILLLLSFSLVKSHTECDRALCASCTNATPFICDTCSSSSRSIVMINSVCLPKCPYGFDTNPCTLNSNAVIDVTFDQSTFKGIWSSSDGDKPFNL